MIIVVAVLHCLSTTIVVLRILCRSLIKRFGLDDLAAVLTLRALVNSYTHYTFPPHSNSFRFV